MNYVKYLMALVALCILSMPAFSMPDDGSAAKDGNDQAFNEQAPGMGPAGDGFQQPCGCPAPMGQDGKNAPCCNHAKSMMGDKCPCGMGDKCSCGHEAGQASDDHNRIKCMMGEKGYEGMQGPAPCAEGKMGTMHAMHVKSMMGDKGSVCPCEPKPKMCGEEGQKGDQGPAFGLEPRKHIKSMMDGAIKPHADAKTIIVNVNL